jgi:hypothetical protein
MTNVLWLVLGLSIGLLGLYWAFVAVSRSVFGVELPDPAGLLPDGVRYYPPRSI